MPSKRNRQHPWPRIQPVLTVIPTGQGIAGPWQRINPEIPRILAQPTRIWG